MRQIEFESVIFDLDGTLTDPREGFVNSIGFALTSLGRDVPPPETLHRFIGPPIHSTFAHLLGDSDPTLVEAAVTLYRERLGGDGIRENTLYPGIEDLLKSLRQDGRRLFVATAKPVVFASRILEHCAIAHYFDGVYGSELARTNTKKAESIHSILIDHRIAPANAAMIGDREHDIHGARECGVYSIGVTYGYGSVAELTAARADILCNSATELAETLVLLRS